MDENSNPKVVQNAYAAFGRGDVDGILGLLADNVEWQSFGPAELPMTGLRRGKPEVGRFFKQVGETWNFERFEPREFIVQGDLVVALGYYSGTAKGPGRKFAAEFAHAFTVQGGKITRFREYTDTANLAAALSGSTAKV
jgi:ketosteroid isomerase-like protein